MLLLVGGRNAAHGSHQGGGCGASVPATKDVHLYVLLLLVGGRYAAHGRHQAGVADASVPATKHVHLYVLLLVGWNAAHGRHQVPQYRPSMFICMCCCW